MSTESQEPEYVVIIPGAARSKYARSAPKYELKVRSAAREQFAEPLRGRNLVVEVYHFYTSGGAIDLDNLLKSILDGLKGAAYEDDSQVVRVVAQRYNISVGYSMENPRPEWIDLLPPWAPPSDFVSVIVSHVP